MIQKRETCLYCGEKMESSTAKKKFCCNLHRVYYAREKARGTLGIDIAIKDGKAISVEYERDSVLPKKKELEQLIEVIAPTGLHEKNNPALSDRERNEILSQIKELENKKCPSYIPSAKFYKQIQLDIQELKNKLQ